MTRKGLDVAEISMTGSARLQFGFGVFMFFFSVLHLCSSRLCYTCPESTSMEECNSKMTRYNCSRIGSFHTMCARSCDWSKGLYTRECSMEHKCATKQDECKNRETNQDPEQKGQPECEYHCCQGNLCNNEPCSLGRNTRSQPKSIMGSVFLSLAFNLITSFF